MRVTFPLIPAAYTSTVSVQVSGFEDLRLLTHCGRLLCDSCSSGQCFAFGFLQIPPRDGHPCRSANRSPCRADSGLSPPSHPATTTCTGQRQSRRYAPCLAHVGARHGEPAGRTCATPIVDIVSTMPSASFLPCAPPQRRFDDLATNAGAISGLALEIQQGQKFIAGRLIAAESTQHG